MVIAMEDFSKMLVIIVTIMFSDTIKNFVGIQNIGMIGLKYSLNFLHQRTYLFIMSQR